MSGPVARLLVLVDDTGEGLPIAEALSRSLPAAEVSRAGTRTEYLALLAGPRVDAVLTDGSVPGCDEIEAFHRARRHDPEIAFLFLAGPGRDPRPLEALGITVLTGNDRAELVIGPGRKQPTAHELLLAATRQFAVAEDLPALLAITRATAARLTTADHVTVSVRDSRQNDYADPQHAHTEAAGPADPLGDYLSHWVERHRQPAVIDDLDADDRVPADLRDARVRSAVIVPVQADHPVAALGAYWERPHSPSAGEITGLQALADSLAAGLEGLHRRRRLAAGLEARAADRTAELAALTYAVSHDLRAPIRHLEGFTRILLQDSADLPPDIRHGAERIQGAAVHLREMVNGMLVLSRITQAEVHPQPVDLAQLGREVAEALAAAEPPVDGSDRAGPVEFVAPATLPATGDPRLLLTVLQDLLGNAWKFTARVPRPRVELGVEAGRPAETADGLADRPPDGPVYFVRDNGAGFDAASADRLFGMFQRLHSGEEFPGTGIGLASVKRIVDKHGGTVRAVGTPDRGATIFFTLPG